MNARPDPTAGDLSEADRVLLERVAARIVALRLEVPAVLALETGRPLSVLAGQTLHFFQPIVQAFLPLPDYGRFAGLIERREVVELLTRMIEARAEAARLARREEEEARRRARKH